jgi:hypothetical protein
VPILLAFGNLSDTPPGLRSQTHPARVDSWPGFSEW